MTSQWPALIPSTVNSVQTVERSVVRQTVENHSPTLENTAAYTHQAMSNNGTAGGYSPRVTRPSIQIAPSQTQPQRTLRMLPSHLAKSIWLLPSGLVRSAP